MIGIFISIPLLWMVDFLNKSHQCQLNMKPFHLIYIIGLNAVLIFIPAIILPILYVVMYMKIKSFGNNTIIVNDSLKERERKSSFKSEINNFKYYKSSTCSTKTNERDKKGMSDSITNESSLFQQTKLSRNFSRETNVLIQITKRKNYLNFIIIVTIVFFCCQ